MKLPIVLLDDLLNGMKGDGRCTFDIVKHEDVEYGMATAAELTYAATSLMYQSIRGRGGVGGIITGVGEYLCAA